MSIAPSAIIHPAASIGQGCQIDALAIVGHAHIGDGTRIGAGTMISDESNLAEYCNVAAGVVIESGVVAGKNVQIGANSTISAGCSIGEASIVQTGSVVTRNVPHNAIVTGNPAAIIGYVDTISRTEPLAAVADDRRIAVRQTGVPGVALHELPVFSDIRGSLSVGELERDLPFAPKRYFLVFDVPSREVRGEHAHLECHQFLICVRGSCTVVADNGSVREEFLLDRPNLGIHLPPMIWGVQYRYSEDATLLVLASHTYDAADYIRSYQDYLDRVRNPGGKGQSA